MADDDRVGIRSVMGSGLIIGRGGEDIIFHPFRDFPDYKLQFEALYDDGYDVSGTTNFIPSDGSSYPKISLLIKWEHNINVRTTGHPGTLFAQNDISRFYLSYYYETIGAKEYYVFRLSYNVLAEAK